MKTIVALFASLALVTASLAPWVRADEAPVADLPELPALTPEELQALAEKPCAHCRKPTAEEQKILDSDPDGLKKLGAISAAEMQKLHEELNAAAKELRAASEELAGAVELGTDFAPMCHLHNVKYRLRWPKPVPVGTKERLNGIPVDAALAYYKANPPPIVEFLGWDQFAKDFVKTCKFENPGDYLTEAELEKIVAQTLRWEEADDQEQILGMRAYKAVRGRETIYLVFFGRQKGVVYSYHPELKELQGDDPGIPGLEKDKLKVYKAAHWIDKMGFGNVTPKEWFEKAKKHLLDDYLATEKGMKDYRFYEIFSNLPILGTLSSLEKILSCTSDASWKDFGKGLFRDIGLVTIFIPGGQAFTVGVIADVGLVILVFATNDKDKWKELKLTAMTLGILGVARAGTVLRAVARMAKAGKLVLPKAYARLVAAYKRSIELIAKWREARKKPCLDVTVKTSAVPDGEVFTARSVTQLDLVCEECQICPLPDLSCDVTDQGVTDDTWLGFDDQLHSGGVDVVLEEGDDPWSPGFWQEDRVTVEEFEDALEVGDAVPAP